MERRALALAFACSACFSLDWGSDPPTSEQTAPRYIEKFCADQSYELVGTAKRTSGLTSDSCGFSVGPGNGTVRFIVPPDDVAFYTSFTFEALVTSDEGTNPHWIHVPEEPMGATGSSFAVSDDGGEKRRVVDVRVVGEFPDDTPGCSIARRKLR